MSKIFDVLKKDALIDLSDMYEAEAEVLEGFEEQPREFREAERKAPLKNHSVRVLDLRVSALAPVLPFDGGHLAAADQYRIIRTKILHHAKKPRLIVVSSPCSGDGKTVTSINIAASLALKADSRVLLVDGDLRGPCVADVLGIPQGPGLQQVLTGTATMESAIVRAEQIPNLFILSSGGANSSAAELLDGHNWCNFIEQIRAGFSTVIFDAAPIATVADYELLQLASDGVILVARQDRTDWAACKKAFETVPKEKLLGVVLNGVEDWWLWKSQGYGYNPKDSPSRRNPS